MQYQLNSDAEVSVRKNKGLKVWATLTIAKCSSEQLFCDAAVNRMRLTGT